jgi:hypothetical protein
MIISFNSRASEAWEGPREGGSFAGESKAWEGPQEGRKSSAGRSEAWGGLREGRESFANRSEAWEGGIGESIGSKGLAGAK